MTRKHVWIVEIREGRKWAPTVGCRLTQSDGREELSEWREHNPDDVFRLVKYEQLKALARTRCAAAYRDALTMGICR